MVINAIKSLINPVLGMVDDLTTTTEEKEQLKNAIKQFEITATQNIITEELRQDDKYTKRARPTMVYAGLVAMFLNHIVLPWVSHFTGNQLPEITLPSEFWLAWGGVTGVYAFQRSIEKIKKK